MSPFEDVQACVRESADMAVYNFYMAILATVRDEDFDALRRHAPRHAFSASGGRGDTIPAAQILSVESVLTVTGGDIVYSAGPFTGLAHDQESWSDGNSSKHIATCHCGSVVLELDLPDGIVDPRRCDCSICRRKGAVVASVPLSGLRVVKGHDVLKLYQFNTKTAKHYFCANCGIYTHHKRRSNPDQYGYNVGCLDGVNPFELPDVATSDGVNHPSDRQ
jgi:hypothetical protein